MTNDNEVVVTRRVEWTNDKGKKQTKTRRFSQFIDPSEGKERNEIYWELMAKANEWENQIRSSLNPEEPKEEDNSLFAWR